MAMKRGTVLMETVLVLPILTLLVFAIVQFALIWYAQIMTHYAAYNAARAALVYHPSDYSTTNEQGKVIFYTKSGVCYDAAVQTLAWVSASPDGGAKQFGIFGWSKIPNSSHVSEQVRIDANESKDGIGVDEDIGYQLPAVVKVKVYFDYPLHVPVIGSMLAYFANDVEKDHPSHWEVTGWTPDSTGMAVKETRKHATMHVDYMRLHAYCVLPKPWSTRRFGRRPTMNDTSDPDQDEVNP